MTLLRRVPAGRQRFAAEYVLPPELVERVRGDHQDAAAARAVLYGLRQWLRLRILTPAPMGMPSLGVQVALGQFLQCTTASATFRRGVCGRRRSAHCDLAGVDPAESAGPTMALTWAMACADQDRRPLAPHDLPWLFAADGTLPSSQGWAWTMSCGREPCRAADHCVHHDLLPHLPATLPRQVHFDRRARPALLDKDDALFSSGLGGTGPGVC